jgi:SRSO17 transposase
MPAPIIAETCPAPEGNLSPRDVEQLVPALQEYHALFAPAFRRPEQHGWAETYLQGLLGDEPRKTIEPIALSLDENVRDLQHFIGQSRWKIAPVVKIHQAVVAQTLGEADGVMMADESGMPKQGDDSVGVARQWCGSLGKVANCQVGVYLGYASRKGYTLVDARLYLPEEWFAPAQAAKRKKCRGPKEVTFQTKPALALALLQAAVERDSLPFQWVVADALYGDTPSFRDGVGRLGKWYFTEVACSTLV